MEFRWNAWNLDHATRHGCTIPEIEAVVRTGGRGYPRRIGGEKYLVVGRGVGGRFVEVIFIKDPPNQAYVIHAMPLSRSGR